MLLLPSFVVSVSGCKFIHVVSLFQALKSIARSKVKKQKNYTINEAKKIKSNNFPILDNTGQINNDITFLGKLIIFLSTLC